MRAFFRASSAALAAEEAADSISSKAESRVLMSSAAAASMELRLTALLSLVLLLCVLLLELDGPEASILTVFLSGRTCCRVGLDTSVCVNEFIGVRALGGCHGGRVWGGGSCSLKEIVCGGVPGEARSSFFLV